MNYPPERVFPDLPLRRTYEIVGDYTGIKCLVCGHTSYCVGDIANLYCGSCHKFHLDRMLQDELGRINERLHNEIQSEILQANQRRDIKLFLIKLLVAFLCVILGAAIGWTVAAIRLKVMR